MSCHVDWPTGIVIASIHTQGGQGTGDRTWPATAKETKVVDWFKELIPKLEEYMQLCPYPLTSRRKLLAEPTKPIEGSTGQRKIDIGFVDYTYNPPPSRKKNHHWWHVIVAGELTCSTNYEKKAKIDLATYVREVFSAQDTRRFVLCFTLCGSSMRRYIEVERDGSKVRLIIDQVIGRACCVAGRATTCWKAHPEEAPHSTVVIKDSWQYRDRVHEGTMLQKATNKRVAHMARHYYHETVQVGGMDDDVQNNIRKGLDITTAENYQPAREMPAVASSASYSSNNNGSFGSNNSSFSKNKRLMPSLTETLNHLPPNRIHRRVILRDYGKPIYEASSRTALLAALEGCIRGHKYLFDAGFLHRDISINNLMINEEISNNNKFVKSFLIDLDLAIATNRNGSSGVEGMAGTRAFMAIGALEGQLHTYMRDLESKIVCRVVPELETWNFCTVPQLVVFKEVVALRPDDRFIATAKDAFHEYWYPLIPHMNKLRRVVFPYGGWKEEFPGLYEQMTDILKEARNDPNVSEEW
ncbi:hypothetical protein F4679DRAFT_573833 [Xylaria curta]|nr:hypothetical protein F4679DRAFT_573833 [Xylaria curta]